MTSHWTRTKRDPITGRWREWRLEGSSVVVRHCGHPTALRPYYVEIDGEVMQRKFRLLSEAQSAAAHVWEQQEYSDADA